MSCVVEHALAHAESGLQGAHEQLGYDLPTTDNWGRHARAVTEIGRGT
jgi:hypothetical protein